MDEKSLSGRLFTEIVQFLYREDRLMRGNLVIRGRPALPAHITSPLLSVVARRSQIVPAESVLPFHRVIGGEACVLWYDGDVGVALQHVGVLVGQSAHKELWPRIISWVRERFQP